MKIAFLSVLIAVLATASVAQDRRERCRLLSGPLLSASDSMSTLVGSFSTMDFAAAADLIGGSEGAQLAELGPLRDAMMPEFLAFVRALDEAALSMRACGRQ
ncbi:hypothetical protein [Pararhodobacter aggregans]|uniref:hypothetical protein n=1 Tax=Pararhodobacter aggregans TaxID=404875 RepID=UPI003A8FE5F6